MVLLPLLFLLCGVQLEDLTDQLGLYLLDNRIDANLILSTPQQNDICILLGGGYKLVVGRLHVLYSIFKFIWFNSLMTLIN